MHIKFLRHGQGNTACAVRYLLQERDHNGERRTEVTVLRGDPHLVAQVADASPHQWRYTSGVIAWAPADNPSLSDIYTFIEEWERAAFAGLAPGQYATCAVLHRDDDGTPHIHTITARVELVTGKALNVAPPGHEKIFDPLRDAWNHAQSWACPDDPDRARYVQPGHEALGRSRPGRHPQARAEITQHIETLAAEGLVTNAQEVRQELAEIGEITRAGAAYVSVRPEGATRSIRLRGELFRDDWTIEQTLEREARRAQSDAAGRAGRRDPAAAERARERLAAAAERRAAYHRARYPQPERPAGHDTERRRGPSAAADRGDRAAAVGRGDPGRAAKPGGRPAQLDAPPSDHGGGDARRGRDGSERPGLADRQPPGAPDRIAAGDPKGRAGAETARGGGDRHAERRPHLPNWGRPKNHGGRDDRQRPDTGDSADGGVTVDDGIGNVALAATRAAAARLRAAGEGAIRSARQAADRTERAAAGVTGATPGAGTQRPSERRIDRASDRARQRAHDAAGRFEDAIEQVTTAYEAWTPRQIRRDWEDRERAALERWQTVPPALRGAFHEDEKASRNAENFPSREPRREDRSPGNSGPGLG